MGYRPAQTMRESLSLRCVELPGNPAKWVHLDVFPTAMSVDEGRGLELPETAEPSREIYPCWVAMACFTNTILPMSKATLRATRRNLIYGTTACEWYNEPMSSSHNTATIDRLLTPAADSMPIEVARWLVGLRADGDLQARLDELADKNTDGIITESELAEYDEYLRASEVIGVLQAKARLALASPNSH